MNGNQSTRRKTRPHDVEQYGYIGGAYKTKARYIATAINNSLIIKNAFDTNEY